MPTISVLVSLIKIKIYILVQGYAYEKKKNIILTYAVIINE